MESSPGAVSLTQIKRFTLGLSLSLSLILNFAGIAEALEPGVAAPAVEEATTPIKSTDDKVVLQAQPSQPGL